ncbi:CapA family protein, partial [Bacteroides stercoris]
LYPSYSPHSHLPQSARNHLNIFIKNTRKFLVLHNTEIYENNK